MVTTGSCMHKSCWLDVSVSVRVQLERDSGTATGLFVCHPVETDESWLTDAVPARLAGLTRFSAAFTHFCGAFRLEEQSFSSSSMASPAADVGQSHQHHPGTESAADSAFLEAQKWIEVSPRTRAESPKMLYHLRTRLPLCGLSYWFAVCLSACRVVLLLCHLLRQAESEILTRHHACWVILMQLRAMYLIAQLLPKCWN